MGLDDLESAIDKLTFGEGLIEVSDLPAGGSSFIEAVGYNPASTILSVKIRGNVYTYPGIGPELAYAFMNAADLGQFYDEHIRIGKGRKHMAGRNQTSNMAFPWKADPETPRLKTRRPKVRHQRRPRRQTNR